MDFVYICRPGNNPELKYSLRSIYANTDVNSVWVVGGKPDWYKGNFLPVRQNKTKYENAQENLRVAIDSNKIPNKFILMNDDFYITRRLDSMPVYHGGYLLDKISNFKKYRPGLYANKLEETYNILKRNGVQHPLDYAIHVPMTVHKQNLSFAVELGGSIRTIYGNMNRIGGIKLPVDDVKIHAAKVRYPAKFDYKRNEFDIPFLSSSDQTFRQLHRGYLNAAFDKPSPLEHF